MTNPALLPPDTAAENRAALLRETAERAIHYLDGLDERPVAASDTARQQLADLDTPLPGGPVDPEVVLDLLDTLGSPATTATAGGRYFGFVTGGTLPAALAANWLAGAWDQNGGLSVMSPIGAALEEIARRWLLEALGFPPGTAAGFVTGGTMANFTALAAARHAVLERAGWDVEADGLFGAPPVTVVVGDEVHVSALKALSLLGFGRDRVTRVPVDGQGRIRADALPPLAGPTIVCTQAGNVNTGAIDPIGEICAWAHDADAWVHVDGAFGLWAAAAPTRAHLLEGVSAADSWALDAHKWLNVPYDSGVALVRDPQALSAAMTMSAAYLQAGASREPYHFTPEMSRRARGIEIWAALLSLGRDGLADLIERTCRHASRFAEGLRAAGYDILNDVTLNQVMVSFGGDDITRQVIAGIQQDGTCWCGGTVWRGRAAMRISVSSWATSDADVERSLEAMLRVAAQAK
ncbi:MAG: aminotransferase class V-fold PLP-dependent enzyme [Chloroflexota bacterium]|nr:aminotransferase class V-fold PLP-dependent enzyme [Chloroflexota bacterium]